MLHIVTGVLWPGAVALVTGPGLEQSLNTADANRQGSATHMIFTVWFALLFLPTILGIVMRRSVDSTGRHPPAARWFFWASLICSSTVLVWLLAVPSAQQREWRLEDDFTQRGGWPVGTSANGEFGYDNGAYRILIKVTEGQVAAGEIAGIPTGRPGDQRFQVLTFETDVIQRTGPPTVLHGIACGTSSTELYFLLINVNGSYLIVRDDAATSSADLLQTGRVGAPIHGIGETNRIQARCVGGRDDALLTLSLNGIEVAKANAQSGKSFDRAMFVVTTLHAIANSTRSAALGLNRDSPGSPTGFEAEFLFDDVVLAGVP